MPRRNDTPKGRKLPAAVRVLLAAAVALSTAATAPLFGQTPPAANLPPRTGAGTYRPPSYGGYSQPYGGRRGYYPTPSSRGHYPGYPGRYRNPITGMFPGRQSYYGRTAPRAATAGPRRGAAQRRRRGAPGRGSAEPPPKRVPPRRAPTSAGPPRPSAADRKRGRRPPRGGRKVPRSRPLSLSSRRPTWRSST